jgi:hypothetical protein
LRAVRAFAAAFLATDFTASSGVFAFLPAAAF